MTPTFLSLALVPSVQQATGRLHSVHEADLKLLSCQPPSPVQLTLSSLLNWTQNLGVPLDPSSTL